MFSEHIRHQHSNWVIFFFWIFSLFETNLYSLRNTPEKIFFWIRQKISLEIFRCGFRQKCQYSWNKHFRLTSQSFWLDAPLIRFFMSSLDHSKCTNPKKTTWNLWIISILFERQFFWNVKLNISSEDIIELFLLQVTNNCTCLTVDNTQLISCLYPAETKRQNDLYRTNIKVNFAKILDYKRLIHWGRRCSPLGKSVINKSYSRGIVKTRVKALSRI